MSFLRSLFTRVPRLHPHEAAPRLRAGNAVLVDVRESNETAKGVVESAVPLPLTDLLGSRHAWTPFLADLRGREMILYCGAGVRSGMAARVLTREGFAASNGGSMSEWTKAGWKIGLARSKP